MPAARALLRHHVMIAFDPIPALAWRAIGVRLWPTQHALRGEAQMFAWARASDAHARPDALRVGSSLREAA